MRAFSKSRRIFWNALMDFIKEERSEMRKRGTSVEEKKLRAEEKGRAVALLPIGVFLVLFLGMGIVFGDFYAMPAIVAFLIALLTAFLQNGKLTFADKMKVISAGIGDESDLFMCRRIFRCSNCGRRCGEYGKSGAFGASAIHCSRRIVCDRLFYFCIHGNLHGNDRSACSDCSRNQ